MVFTKIPMKTFQINLLVFSSLDFFEISKLFYSIIWMSKEEKRIRCIFSSKLSMNSVTRHTHAHTHKLEYAINNNSMKTTI